MGKNALLPRAATTTKNDLAGANEFLLSAPFRSPLAGIHPSFICHPRDST
jgi:hypothetical protein